MADFRLSRRHLMATLPAAILPSSLSAGGFHAAPRNKTSTDLARAAQRLQTTATVMMVGAHPDDERSGLLATIRYLYGAQVVIVLATRGDGGQNAIGPEKGLALAALRTREMEEAARVLDASVEWLADGPEDAFPDFGYSRSKEDTFERWGGRDLLVARLAEAIRRHRPDVIIGAFPDEEGQHAHHRAVVSAAEDAILLAAAGEAKVAGLAPWRVGFHFNPVSMADRSAGDIAIDASALDPLSGLSFAAIGELSRIQHRSQNQGVANPSPPSTWLLRAVNGAPAPGNFDAIAARFAFGGLAADGLPARLTQKMREAQTLISSLPANLNDFGKSVSSGVRLGRAFRSMQRLCRQHEQAQLLHRVAKARRQLDAFLHMLCAGARITLGKEALVQGKATRFSLAAAMPTRLQLGHLELAPGLRAERTGAASGIIHVADEAIPTSAFPRRFDVLGGNGPLYAVVGLKVGSYVARSNLDPQRQTNVIPAQTVDFDRDALAFNLGAGAGPKTVKLLGTNVEPRELRLSASHGWRIEAGDEPASFRVYPPAHPGPARLDALIGGRPAQSVRRIVYPHVGERHLTTPSQIPMRALSVALPAGAVVCCLTRDGKLGTWLSEIGLAGGQFESLPPLAGFTTVIAGSDAFMDDRAHSAALIEWIASGGHFVVYAQRRTRDGSLGIRLPINLEIGRPRNAYRVSRPDADVRILKPGHALLAAPNRIDASDWQEWVQERAVGLASSWDPTFTALVSTADPGQAPSSGALLSAIYGQGRITYVALALERQLDALVPGAFRLAANLAQPARTTAPI